MEFEQVIFSKRGAITGFTILLALTKVFTNQNGKEIHFLERIFQSILSILLSICIIVILFEAAAFYMGTIEEVKKENTRKINNKMRVLIIGESGKGKSSLIKLLTGIKSIQTSNAAIGCTFQYQTYEHDDALFVDTTGLGEGSKGTVPDATAVKQLINFLKNNKDGFSLMVMVRSKSRITKIDENNYKLFYAALCEEKIPILLVISGCEFDNPIDKWWSDNKSSFIDTYGMKFIDGVSVCLADDCTIMDLNPSVKKVIEKAKVLSKANLIDSFNKFCLPEPMPIYTNNWYNPFQRVFRFILNHYGLPAGWMLSNLAKILIRIGYSEKEAAEIADAKP